MSGGVFDAVDESEFGSGVEGLGAVEFFAECGDGPAAARRGHRVDPYVQFVT